MIHPRHSFEEAGQGHVFRFFDTLPSDQQDSLTRQAAGIDLAELSRLIETEIQGSEHQAEDFSDLEPASYRPVPEHGGDKAAWIQAEEAGEAALRAGRVAAFTVAGGQGTRLGFDGPKGAYPTTPVRNAPLFQVFAEKIRAASERYGKAIPWYIMTSDINHAATTAFFEENGFFGLAPERVRFFSQGLMPAVDFDGKILMASPSQIALSPDGHGGSLRALVRSGAIAEMETQGIDVISYFQVDNPLVACIDPAFIGFHLLDESELSSKTVPKTSAGEKVGVFCVRGGKTQVVEYSDLPADLAEETDENGELRFRAGSIAIHLFDRDFVARVGGGKDEAFRLPFHLARKKVPTIDEAGNPVEPTEPNGIKFEMFVFDALPFAQNPLVIETKRADEFSPVKNAEGADSLATSQAGQRRQWARWCKAAEIPLETDDTGLPEVIFEVSPLFADTEERFIEAWKALEPKPEVEDGLVLGEARRAG